MGLGDLRLWVRPLWCGTDATSSVTSEIYPGVDSIRRYGPERRSPFPLPGWRKRSDLGPVNYAHDVIQRGRIG